MRTVRVVPDSVEGRARAVLLTYFIDNPERVFYSRQLEVIFERQFFHWITNRALRGLIEEKHVVMEERRLDIGSTIKLVWHKSYRFYKRSADGGFWPSKPLHQLCHRRRGDALRGDIVVPSLAYEAAHAVVLDVQRKQAVEDAIRERTDPAARAARLVSEAASAPPAQSQSDASTVAPLVQDPLPKPPLTARPGSLVARFHAAAPAPNTLEERQVFARVLKIVIMVERVLAALSDLAKRFRQHADNRDRRMAAKLDMDYQLDGCRAQRAPAKEKLEQWETNHRCQVATARAFGNGDGGRSKAWQSLIGNFEAC